MVFFTCNQCGDSLKKNKVDQHSRICRTNTITCMDCLKDFTLINYSNHIECITEDQKYGGPNNVDKQFKGKNKQNEWIKRIKILIQQNQYPKEISSILNSLINYENIPRKRAKFINFVKNSFRIRDEKLIDKVWSIFENSLKNDQTNVSTINATKENENNQSKQVDELQKTQNGAESNIENNSNESTIVDQPEKIKMKRKIIDILEKHEQIPLKKLRKKVLKSYHRFGDDDDERIMKKFDKIIAKKRFINNNDIITLAY